MLRTVFVEESWALPDAAGPDWEVRFDQYPTYRDDLNRGEPVVVADLQSVRSTDRSAVASTVVYRAMTAPAGPQRVLLVHSTVARDWSPEDLAFIREAAERTRGAIDQRRVEQDLRNLASGLEREVEARTTALSRLWRNSRDLLAVMDRAGALRAANPAWTTILGWPPESVIGRSFLSLVHPDDHPSAEAALGQAGEAETPSFEARYRHEDGGYRWISWVTAPEDDLLYATGRHITAEKGAAAELEVAQARLRTFFETSYQYRALIALDGRLLDANGTALAAAGASLTTVSDELLWRTPWFAHTPGLPDAVRSAVADVAAGAARREDIYLHLPTVGWRWLDFTLRPLRDARGVSIAIVLEAVDITERRQTEAALRQSQKLEAMGQLTGGVAHDFNNLLTPIIGGLDLLQQRGLGGEREQRLIDGALQSAERAKVLVQRLLAFARRQPLKPKAVDVSNLVDGIADLVSSTAGPRIRVVVDAPRNLPPARADANQLEMAILNLSVNARDAMPDGGALKISVAAEHAPGGDGRDLAPGDYVRLSVSDTGLGMDEATLARAIEPFFSTKGRGRGTGLGLSMAHGLASQLGGSLSITSTPGAGTTVELWLPASEVAESTQDRSLPADALRPRTGAVLLVDDEALARASTATILADLGFRVTEAASGEQALALLDSGTQVDLLITDHLMPGMTGAELATAFSQRRPGIPVLVITGYADVIPAGLPHLSKPFRRVELAASLAAITTG
jgi:PAS domain S-box-containing protein